MDIVPPAVEDSSLFPDLCWYRILGHERAQHRLVARVPLDQVLNAPVEDLKAIVQTQPDGWEWLLIGRGPSIIKTGEHTTKERAQYDAELALRDEMLQGEE